MCIRDRVRGTIARRAAGRVPVHLGQLDAGAVHGDAAPLGRIVENLVANAVRHAASKVDVTVTASARWVQLRVDDDGPGVPVEERARIFQPFVRLDADRSRQGGGTGLGLAIVAELVAAHGGTITVGDAHPGASFAVRFPHVADPALPPGSVAPVDGVLSASP